MPRLTTLTIVFALGTILLTATFVPFAKTAVADEDNPLALVATTKDTPKFTLKGKVLNPDGTPAGLSSIWFRSITIYESPREFANKPTYYPSSGGATFGTDRDGNFSREVAPGTHVMLYVYSTASSLRKHVSQPLVFIADRNRNDLTLQLEEGTLVYGQGMFEDGPPAKDRTIVGLRPFAPLIPVQDVNVVNAFIQNFVLEFQTRVKADGKYELYLPPGEFLVKEYDDRDEARAVPVSIEIIKEARKEQQVDFLKVPAPLRGKFVKEDGSDPGRLEVYHVAKIAENSTSGLSARIESGGEFAYERKAGSLLIAVTDDRSLGVIYPIPDDKLGEYHTVVVRPVATAKLKLSDPSGKPVVGQEIVTSVGIITKTSSNATTITVRPSTTDADGVATLKLPPGSGQYKFSWEKEGQEWERVPKTYELTLQPGETVEIALTVGDDINKRLQEELLLKIQEQKPPPTLQDRIRDFFGNR
jgi:hypothetical protein